MIPSSIPELEYRIDTERSETGGHTVFVIIDAGGEYVEPTCVYTSQRAAEQRLKQLIEQALEALKGERRCSD